MPALPKSAFVAVVVVTAGVSIAAVAAAVTSTGDEPPEVAAPPAASSTNDAARSSIAPLDATIVDFAFQPEPITVAVGQEVTWTNENAFAHTVRATDGSFDSGRMDQGVTFSTSFAVPGTYAYLCGIHNSMTGTVVVEP